MPAGLPSLDNTLGAAFIGNVLAAILYGITCLQTFVFYKKQYQDSLSFKLVIYFLWLIDTVHIALVTHCMYIYLVTNFDNIFILLVPNWSLLASVYLTCISDMIVRTIYARRVWKISNQSVTIITLVGIATLTAFGGGFAYATKGFELQTFARISQISYLMYLTLGSAVVADLLIAGTICFHLGRSRTGCKRTDSIANVLILYTINSGLVTTICSVACFITYTIWPQRFIYIGIYLCLSKLFLTNLLAMLNARDGLKQRVRGLSDLGSSLSNMPSGGRTGDFNRDSAYNVSYGSKELDMIGSRDDNSRDMPTVHTAVMITYDRHVVIGEAC